MSNRKVRVRFAPSPTGPLHMGGVRTALYNYLFAKKHGGTFILRIEDTDQTRLVPGAEDYVIESLKWCNIKPDEGQAFGGEFGPYKQSERKHMYRAYADQLLDSGHAYIAFDTAEQLDEMRSLAKKAGTANWQYNHVSRNQMVNSLTLSTQEVEKRLANNEPYVIRIKLNRNEEVKFHDLIRGWVSVNTNNMDDKVLFKSDGMPTYHLANIVDDHLMNISHVIRGEEWLPSAPLHILLYRYFGWEESMPEFAHLPLLLKPDGNGKLSKRDGDRLGFPVFPLEWINPETKDISSGYKESGYFAEAFTNMLAFLGWNPGTEQEIFSMDELIQSFSLERVNKAGAKFDFEKTKWFNQQYLRSKTDPELAELLQEGLGEKGKDFSLDYLKSLLPILKERAYFVSDMITEGNYFFEAPSTYEESVVMKKWSPEVASYMGLMADNLEALDDFTAEGTEAMFKDFLVEHSVGFGKIGPVYRLCLTGRGMGASIFEILNVLGKEESVARIRRAIETIA